MREGACVGATEIESQRNRGSNAQVLGDERSTGYTEAKTEKMVLLEMMEVQSRTDGQRRNAG